MDVTSARARLVESSGDRDSTALATIPVGELDEALRLEQAPELILDVTRITGDGEEQTTETGRILVLWDKQDLEDLRRKADGDSVTLAFDASTLNEAFDSDVEGHGLREGAALLAVAVVAGGGAWAGSASAQPDQTTGGSATIEQVRSDAAAPPGATIEAARSAAAAGATASAAADIEAVRLAAGNETIAAAASTPGVSDIEAVRLAAGNETIAAAASTPGVSDIEAVRLAAGNETIAAADTTAISEIEAIRAHEIAVSLGGPAGAESVEAARSAEIAASASSAEGSSSIEAVRSAAAEASRAAADTGGGISVSMPDPAVIGFLAGGIALLITGAAFAAQRQRMRPAS